MKRPVKRPRIQKVNEFINSESGYPYFVNPAPIEELIYDDEVIREKILALQFENEANKSHLEYFQNLIDIINFEISRLQYRLHES